MQAKVSGYSTIVFGESKKNFAKAEKGRPRRSAAHKFVKA